MSRPRKLTPALRKALAAVPSRRVRDHAAETLALTYAAHIDVGGEIDKLGPRLLQCLEALQMTPRSRAMAQRGEPVAAASDGPVQPSPDSRSELDAIRERRSRKSGAPSVDSPAAGADT